MNSIPCSIESEQYLLGVVIRDNLDLNEIGLKAQDFFEPRHQDIAQAAILCKQDLIEINEISIGSVLLSKGLNYTTYINECTTNVGFTALNKFWAQEIKRTAKLRQIQLHAKKLLDYTTQPESNPDALLDYAEGTFKSFSRETKTGLQEMQLDALSSFDRTNDEDAVIGKYRWLCKGGSLLLVSQSGVGKSSFTMQFVITLCTQYQKGFFGIKAGRPLRVVILQAENDLGDIAEPFQDILKGMQLSQTENELLFENLRIFRDTASVGQEFLKRMKELIVLHRADVFVVDPLLSFAGIEVSDQKQMTEFLRHGVARVLEETGAVLIAVHHTTKPRSSKDREGQTDTDLAYSGAGASELVNYVREVGVLQRAQGSEPIFKFSLTKRRNRAGMKNIDGDFSHEIYVRHSREQNTVKWEYSLPPDDLRDKETAAKNFRGR
jgi:RecA-family ATPase